jgi:hypothetical protein
MKGSLIGQQIRPGRTTWSTTVPGGHNARVIDRTRTEGERARERCMAGAIDQSCRGWPGRYRRRLFAGLMRFGGLIGRFHLVDGKRRSRTIEPARHLDYLQAEVQHPRPAKRRMKTGGPFRPSPDCSIPCSSPRRPVRTVHTDARR